MPVNERTIIEITCDNPDCPGNELDSSDRTGWLFITSEVYGQPSQSHVFCSQSCVNAATADSEILSPPETPAMMPLPEPPVMEEPAPAA